MVAVHRGLARHLIDLRPRYNRKPGPCTRHREGLHLSSTGCESCRLQNLANCSARLYIDERHPAYLLNSAFRKMIINEYREIGEPPDCHVYLRADPDGAFSYFFSPSAAKTLKRS